MTRHVTLLLILSSLAACGGDSSGPGGQQPTHPVGIITASPPLGGHPHGVATAASGVFYISRIDVDSLTRGQVDSVDQAFTGSVAVGDVPAHVALTPDGSTAFSANQYDNSVSVVDVASNTNVGTIPLSDGGFNLLVSPDGSTLWVTTASGVLHVVSTATRSVTDTIHLGAATNGLAWSEARQRLYVSSIAADSIYAIDPATNAVAKGYDVGGMPQRIAVHSAGDELYLATEAVGLEVLNLFDGSRTAVPGVAPGAVGLALSPDEKVLYVTNPPAGQLVIVNRKKREVIQTYNGLASPRNVAFAAGGRVAIVTGEGNVVYFVR